jgi:hypothetical protein
VDRRAAAPGARHRPGRADPAASRHFAEIDTGRRPVHLRSIPAPGAAQGVVVVVGVGTSAPPPRRGGLSRAARLHRPGRGGGPCPQALRERDGDGDLPLHRAFFQEMNHDTIRYLLLEYPESIREEGGARHKHRKPLWMAFDRWHTARSLSFIQFLVELSPESLQERDRQGRTPLTAAADGGRTLDSGGAFGGAAPRGAAGEGPRGAAPAALSCFEHFDLGGGGLAMDERGTSPRSGLARSASRTFQRRGAPRARGGWAPDGRPGEAPCGTLSWIGAM